MSEERKTIDDIIRTLTSFTGSERIPGRDDSGDFKALLSSIKNYISGLPPGIIQPFGGSTIPNGYLYCDGSAISRTIYADLFTVIGTTWGIGDGSTTFNLPDLRGTFLRGTGSHGSETMADGNPFAGPSVGDFEDDQFQGHWHEFRLQNVVGNGLFAKSADGASPGDGTTKNIVTDGVNGTPRSGDETRPFAAGIKYIIKY